MIHINVLERPILLRALANAIQAGIDCTDLLTSSDHPEDQEMGNSTLHHLGLAKEIVEIKGIEVLTFQEDQRPDLFISVDALRDEYAEDFNDPHCTAEEKADKAVLIEALDVLKTYFQA